MHTYQTPFGQIEVDPDTIITFPSGLLGFPNDTHYKLLHEEHPEPQVLWLQSLDNDALCFTVVPAERLGFNFQITLSDEECAEIELTDSDEACLLLMLSRHGDKPSNISINTQAPFVINPRTRKALQKTGIQADVIFRNI